MKETKFVWAFVKNTLKDLNVLTINGEEYGFIYRIGPESFWCVFVGIGDKTIFKGHAETKFQAKRVLEDFYLNLDPGAKLIK